MKDTKRGMRYEKGQKQYETPHAILYSAEDVDDTNNLAYVWKQYRHGELKDILAENEIKVSQSVENYAGKSVAIPIIHKTDENVLIMQLQHNGMFLDSYMDAMMRAGDKWKSQENDQTEMTLKVILAVISSLDALHNFQSQSLYRGCLHLDIHPGNIFLENCDAQKGDCGIPKFIDFSNAVLIDKEKTVSKTNLVSGMNLFSAPEMFYGYEATVSAETDLFSVCAMMFYYLFGKSVAWEDGELLQGQMEEIIQASSYPEIIKQLFRSFFLIGLSHERIYRFNSCADVKKKVEEMLELLRAITAQNYVAIAQKMPHGINFRRPNCVDGIIFEQESFHNAVVILADWLKQTNINISECARLCFLLLYLYQANEDGVREQDIGSLLNCAIACRNHTAGNALSRLVGDILPYNLHRVNSEDLGQLQNRLSVGFVDHYEFDRAVELDRNTISVLQAQNTGKFLISPDETEKKPADLGRAYSSYAAHRVFQLREGISEDEKEDILKHFSLALDVFEGDQGNTDITISHLLAFAIEIKDRGLYEKYVRHDRLSFTPDDFDRILHMNEDGRKFQLYLWLKSLYVLYFDKMTDELAKRLKSFINNEKLPEHHPNQLILKYIGLIFYRYDNGLSDAARTSLEKSIQLNADDCHDNDGLNVLKLISKQNEACFYELEKNTKEEERLREELMLQARRYDWNALLQALKDGLPLSRIFNYEYA